VLYCTVLWFIEILDDIQLLRISPEDRPHQPRRCIGHRPFSLGLSLAPEILKIIALTNRCNILTNISLSQVLQLEGICFSSSHTPRTCIAALLIIQIRCCCCFIISYETAGQRLLRWNNDPEYCSMQKIRHSNVAAVVQGTCV
jgi:hypothetical protein